jgi:hypothetical protein
MLGKSGQRLERFSVQESRRGPDARSTGLARGYALGVGTVSIGGCESRKAIPAPPNGSSLEMLVESSAEYRRGRPFLFEFAAITV